MADVYCGKCKSRKRISEVVEETMKNGRKAIKGKCLACGTAILKLLSDKANPAPPIPTASN